MGILPETTRLRTPVILLAILLACVAFLGFNYWTEYSRSLIFQKRIAFLEGTIVKVSNEDAEADAREKDFQRELKRQKAKDIQMNALLQSEVSKISNRFQLEKDHLLQNLDEKDAIIQEKQALLDGMKKDFQALQLEMESFQRNQSKLLEKFTLQSETVKMVLRLKERCYAQMNEIARVGNKSGWSYESVPARESQRPGDKADQLEGNVENNKKEATPEPIPAIKQSASSSLSKTLLQLFKLGSDSKNISSDSAKASDIANQTLERIVPAATIEKKNNPSLEIEEEERPAGENVGQKTPTDTATQTLKRIVPAAQVEKDNNKVIPPLEEEGKESTGEEVNKKPPTESATKPLKRVVQAAQVEKDKNKVIPPLEEEDEESTGEEVNKKPPTESATKPLKRTVQDAQVEKENSIRPPSNKDDEQGTEVEVPTSVNQKPPAFRPEGEQDALAPGEDEEAADEESEQPSEQY